MLLQAAETRVLLRFSHASALSIPDLLCTKVGRSRPFGQPRLPDGSSDVWDFSYDFTLRSVAQSLQRLQTDRLDVVHIHDPDHSIEEALRGTYRALQRLRDEGVVGAIGVGSNSEKALAELARQGEFACFLLANRYTLLEQPALPELLPLCQQRGIAVIAGGIFNSGVLATGAGASARISIGIAVFYGMIASTCLVVVFVPSFYVVMQGIQERFTRRAVRDEAAAVQNRS